LLETAQHNFPGFIFSGLTGARPINFQSKITGSDEQSAGMGEATTSRADANLQQTLRNKISCTGVGLHSGTNVAMTLMPADAGTGIVFRRTDLDAETSDIPGLWQNVSGTMLGTTLVNEHGTSVATVEHLMAALAGCGIDNALIELNAGEVPIMDGSSAPFVFLIECAGTLVQDAVRRAIRVLKPVTVTDAGRTVTLRPAERFTLSVDIDFDSPVVAHQTCEFDDASMTFKDELCRARTFGFLHEVSALQEKGLARGGSLDNAVVIDGDRVMNEEGLRFDDEFARHKALDAVGDLYLAGGRLLARYEGQKAGHEMNNRALRALFADASAWEWCDDVEAGVVPVPQDEWVEERAVAIA
jgi:UDP-3-O-[3-hydroxymyristoyl] N-acetylglucosamine deacetylase